MVAQFAHAVGPTDRPKGEPPPKEETASVPIPGTPFRLTAEGRLQVAVDLQELLTNQGISAQLAQKLLDQKDPEAVAKVLLNALYLESQGKLQNGPGYIRAGIEDGYDLLPQVANRLEIRRRELSAQIERLKLKSDSSAKAKHTRPSRRLFPTYCPSSRQRRLIGSWKRLFNCSQHQLSLATRHCPIPLCVQRYMNLPVEIPSRKALFSPSLDKLARAWANVVAYRNFFAAVVFHAGGTFGLAVGILWLLPFWHDAIK